MKTMEELCKRFGDLHPGYEAYLDEPLSYRNYYRVYIYDTDSKLGTWYAFHSCKEFKEWSDGVY